MNLKEYLGCESNWSLAKALIGWTTLVVLTPRFLSSDSVFLIILGVFLAWCVSMITLAVIIRILCYKRPRITE